MDMANDSGGYGIGFPWHYIFGLIILFFIIRIIFIIVKRKKSQDQ